MPRRSRIDGSEHLRDGRRGTGAPLPITRLYSASSAEISLNDRVPPRVSLSHGLQLKRLGAFGKPGAVQGRDGHRFTRLETRRSNSRATMMIVPIAVPCQKGDTPMRFSPLRIITVMNTPISVPTMEPRPP